MLCICYWKDSFSTMTLFNPSIFWFYPCTKLLNVFFEVFLVQICRKLQKIHSEVCVKGKKNFKNTFWSLKLGAKTEIQGGKSWGWKEKNFPTLSHVHVQGPLCFDPHFSSYSSTIIFFLKDLQQSFLSFYCFSRTPYVVIRLIK
jgi:hypothetical protein